MEMSSMTGMGERILVTKVLMAFGESGCLFL